jgi:hypothetical protein
MKKTMIVLVVMMMLLLSSVALAFAAQNDSGYITWNSGLGNPHQGYTTTTTKCAVCHAVHHAGPAGDGLDSERLLKSTRANSCTYCHISPGVSGLVVYGGASTNWETSSTQAHDSGGSGLSCSDCHQVHGAANDMTGNTYLDQKILIKSLESIAGTTPGNALAGVSSEADTSTAVSRWCSGCHSYFYTTRDEASHVMTGTPSGSAAFVASPQCKSCHNSTVGTVSQFPHYADGARFLTTATETLGGGMAPATVGNADGVCLRCHRNGTNAGIGLSE